MCRARRGDFEKRKAFLKVSASITSLGPGWLGAEFLSEWAEENKYLFIGTEVKVMLQAGGRICCLWSITSELFGTIVVGSKNSN